MKPARKRTRAREIAVQALYQEDAHQRTGGAPTEEIDGFIERESGGDPEVRDFARDLVRGTWESLEDIDVLLAGVVENWKVERIAAMDRAILRLSAYEIHARPDVPPKVSINEAIELAKKYSTSGSGAFVNGVLDRLLRLREMDRPGAPGADRRQSKDESTGGRS